MTQSDITLDVENGKNTGFAIIEFHSQNDKFAALKFDRKPMGTRWIGVSQAELMKKVV